jgi:hypothetical protein
MAARNPGMNHDASITVSHRNRNSVPWFLLAVSVGWLSVAALLPIGQMPFVLTRDDRLK